MEFKKLKIAIGISGRCIFLEKFPDDEDHVDCNEQISAIEDAVEFDEKPGIYLASFHWVQEQNHYDGNHDGYIDIKDVELINGF